MFEVKYIRVRKSNIFSYQKFSTYQWSSAAVNVSSVMKHSPFLYFKEYILEMK